MGNWVPGSGQFCTCKGSCEFYRGCGGPCVFTPSLVYGDIVYDNCWILRSGTLICTWQISGPSQWFWWILDGINCIGDVWLRDRVFCTLRTCERGDDIRYVRGGALRMAQCQPNICDERVIDVGQVEYDTSRFFSFSSSYNMHTLHTIVWLCFVS